MGPGMEVVTKNAGVGIVRNADVPVGCPAFPALAGIVAGLLLAIACRQVLAQSASFGATLRVLPGHVATGAPVDLPRPPQAQVLPPGRHSSRLLYAGSANDARRFYEDTLPQLGFHLTQDKSDGAVWERADIRAELLFYPVAGMQDATGIMVMMLPHERAPAATPAQ